MAALRLRPRDTVARWIALTTLIAMLTSLAFNALFIQLAGVWAYPPLAETGLLEKTASITRMMEASQASQREGLAKAASENTFSVSWHATRQGLDLPDTPEAAYRAASPEAQRLFNTPTRRVEAYQPGDWPQKNGHYALLVQLADESWLMFSVSSRSWGLAEGPRTLIVILLVLLSTGIVALIATRRLAKPLQHFAQGARRFGVDFRAPPIDPVGPHEIRQAILAFNAMQAQLQHFIKDRTQMLAAISHDLRTPLTRMRLRGEFIEDPEQQQRLFRDVDEMQAMINSALEFFRDDARLEQATQFDLAELLQTLIDDYRDQSIDITFSGPPRLVYFGRPLGLKRVITNLLDNAIKYASEPAIELCQEDEQVIVRVLDRGPGIPADSYEQVFAPFFRLEGSRNKSTGGVGLGLSSARAIVLEHGGTLTVRNRSGGGLEARVVLPVQVG
ncbi:MULTISPECIES: ATP-binding protein [unclassified Pseudomonas]|uniref:sensor histidine kinase n=1 Tax=unclassified Pseudomonas TaxID=196821 RepID=UPI000CD10256|nr:MULTISPECIES: ATP-binding protein [unclassified Pseudomonas]POA29207.1 two-component sensor histidine kinase [Pseudomonas sp. GW456-R21]POA63772.1 two-component sensor histidine kinase [Pseudomonas sp. GW460-R15]